MNLEFKRELPSARVVRVIEETRAEVLRRQLNHVRHHPSVEPIETETRDLHDVWSLVFNLLLSIFCRNDVMT